MTPSLPLDFFGQTGLGTPFVIAQLGQSLDGRIATISGESRGIGGTGGLDHLHRLRAQADAVLVGVGTIEADDPSLTVRRVIGQSPLRVVIDPDGRMSRQARCLEGGGLGCLIITASDAIWPEGVDILRLPLTEKTIAPAHIVRALADRGISRLLVEGGAFTISRFVDADCIDAMHIVVSPVIIGSGTASLQLRPQADLARARRPKVRVHDLGGGDILFECDLRNTPFNANATRTIYKITPAALWQRAEEMGCFTGAPVDVADGFIHFSTSEQVPETAARHFVGQTDLLLVSVDPARLGSMLKWETSRGGALFPHLYMDLPLAAVVRVAPMRVAANGDWDFVGLLE